jgi:hypothetical protein
MLDFKLDNLTLLPRNAYAKSSVAPLQTGRMRRGAASGAKGDGSRATGMCIGRATRLDLAMAARYGALFAGLVQAAALRTFLRALFESTG